MEGKHDATVVLEDIFASCLCHNWVKRLVYKNSYFLELLVSILCFEKKQVLITVLPEPSVTLLVVFTGSIGW